jgi:hypothetical protein
MSEVIKLSLEKITSRQKAALVREFNLSNTRKMTVHESQFEPWVLVEGPSCADAEFTAQWLLAAISADRLLEDYYAVDPSFQPSILALETMYCVEFVPAAMAFVRKWLKIRSAFSLSLLDSQWSNMFAIMAGAGFFTRTNDRYQMALPKNLMFAQIKHAILKLAATEDSEYFHHPEQFLTTMSRYQAKCGKQKLRRSERLDWQQRIADRDALLAKDPSEPSSANNTSDEMPDGV